MRKLLTILLFVFFAVVSATAQAAVISLIPADTEIALGDAFTLDVNISGLGDGTAPSVAGFAMSINFDSSILSYDSVVFGDYLGVGGLEASYFSNIFTAGLVYFDGFSFLSGAELDTLQPGDFNLMTITFKGVGQGTSPLIFVNPLFADGYAGEIFPDIFDACVTVSDTTSPTATPVPPSILLLGSGLIGVVGFRRKIKK